MKGVADEKFIRECMKSKSVLFVLAISAGSSALSFEEILSHQVQICSRRTYAKVPENNFSIY